MRLTVDCFQGDFAGDVIKLEFTGSLSMGLVWCPPGTFQMGCDRQDPYCSEGEGPQHEVELTEGFWIGQIPMTWQMWNAIRRSFGNPDWPHARDSEKAPAHGMSRDSAVSFCRRLRVQLRKSGALGEKLHIDIPTEAQWEYACRAGTETSWFFGSSVSDLDDYAWYRNNSKDSVHMAGEKKPNPWGIYDLYGNVSEWCRDSLYRYSSAKELDPLHEDSEAKLYVARGGGYSSSAEDCRSASRLFIHRNNEFGEEIGVRIVCMKE
jgi:formylglycine-generating enzyme required for sulfatase activity